MVIDLETGKIYHDGCAGLVLPDGFEVQSIMPCTINGKPLETRGD